MNCAYKNHSAVNSSAIWCKGRFKLVMIITRVTRAELGTDGRARADTAVRILHEEEKPHFQKEKWN